VSFLEIFSKNPQIPNLINSVQWKPNCSMRTDGQTWRN